MGLVYKTAGAVVSVSFYPTVSVVITYRPINATSTTNMKFLVVAFIVAVAVASLAEGKSVNSESIEPAQTKETLENNLRDKRGYVLGAYTAPVAYSAAYTAPVAYAASYSYPYAYAGYPYYASAYAAPYYVA